MAVISKALQPGVILTSTAQPVFTAGVGTSIVSGGVLANQTSAAVTFTLQVQRSGGQAIDLVPQRVVQANGTDLLPEIRGLVLNAGDAILASGNSLALILNGYAMS
ncbi:hypothetical protein [Neokomagataea anthophila]|uniref:DUF2190 family protein n=1 Tax=Neokomagataea anthophila TaxID=2826925 RepID=A0ABS5E822_9PROT|nr:hypothetical protein [Neokomagataea anthophila]MBR0560051.1 hypothetical protein [Neokomagataea anthophila]